MLLWKMVSETNGEKTITRCTGVLILVVVEDGLREDEEEDEEEE